MNLRYLLKYTYIVTITSFFIFTASCSSEKEDNAADNNSPVKESIVPDNKSNIEIEFEFKKARWEKNEIPEKSNLSAKGKGTDGETISVVNASRESQVIGTAVVINNRWRLKKIQQKDLAAVPCKLRAVRSNGKYLELDVQDAPEDCDVDF